MKAHYFCLVVLVLASALLSARTATALDCNLNGREDAEDLGTSSSDCNSNEIPDECEAMPHAFGSLSDYEVADFTSDMTLGDFDSDGLLDVAVGHGEGVSLLLTSETAGSDGLRAPEDFRRLDYNVEGRSEVWKSADLDGDGNLDLIMVDVGGLVILYGNGDGTFEPPSQLATPPGVLALAAADLDGDGASELIVTNRRADTVSVYFGTPTRVWAAPLEFDVGDNPVAVLVADLDANDLEDVITINRDSRNITILFGSTDGMPLQGTTVDLPSRPQVFTAADLNADGIEDIAVLTEDGLTILSGSANGSPATSSVPLPAERPSAVAASDFDADGDLDLIGGFQSPRGVIAIVNSGDGTFVTTQKLPILVLPTALVSTDMDGDGDDEILVTLFGRPTANLFWNGDLRGGPLVSLVEKERILVNIRPHSTQLEDFDADGDLDLAMIDGGGRIALMRNDGAGSLGAVEFTPMPDARGMWSLAAADLDNDGDIDLTSVEASRGGLATNSLLVVALNNGDGTFTPTRNYDASERGFYVTTADIDLDGFQDIVTTSTGTSTMGIYYNKRDTTFEDEVTTPVRSNPTSIAVGDYDLDGDEDLAVSNAGSAQVSVFLNLGERRLSPRVDYDVDPPQFVYAFDYDSDGDLDLVTSSESADGVSFLENDASGSFTLRQSVKTNLPPYSMVEGDFNGDGLQDLLTADRALDALTLLMNTGAGRFVPTRQLSTGDNPRFAVVGDLDGDGDEDIISTNHSSLDVTIFDNQNADRVGVAFRETICTPLDFHELSIRSVRGGNIRRLTKYIARVDSDDDTLVPTLFHNVQRYPLHQQFLAAEFPDRFPVELYDQLVGLRAGRKYFSGIVFLLDTPDGPLYGYNVLTNFEADAAELPTFEEVRGVHEELEAKFSLRPLAYFPDAALTRESAAEWPDTSFVYFDDGSSTPQFEAYTLGVAFGRVRLHTRESFEEANDSGRIGFQDVVVLDHAPRDIEGVVAAVLTAERQSDLSHLSVRTARRGTPNAFASDLFDRFAEFADTLVRVEVTSATIIVRSATIEEAEEWWQSSRPQLSVLPTIDVDYARLDSLVEVDIGLVDPTPESRWGGKATNMARLQTILVDQHAQYSERGFAIPMRHYLNFLRANTVVSPRSGAQVTYEQLIAELETWPEFQSDSALRFAVLDELRDHMRDESTVDASLVADLVRRIDEVFGTTRTAVRFRSSSNAEDALEFNGAGLYDSTSVCAADTLDADDRGPSHCDPTKSNERSVERALRRVWASNWNFRAYEERAFFGMPQEQTAMGILVSRAFLDERVNGVVLTGNPNDPFDGRYIVTAQVGEESVVSPEPGVIAETNLLSVEAGEVRQIIRQQPSTLVEPGEHVLSDEQLQELGALVWHIDRELPIDTGDFPRLQVLLDLEFKIERNGDLAVKQVRPFLRNVDIPPTPTFTLEVPAETIVCGVFVHSRGNLTALELKSQIHLTPQNLALPTTANSLTANLFDQVLLGPDSAPATPLEDGNLRLVRTPRGETTEYRFRYEQRYQLASGEEFTIELQNLEYLARGEDVLRGGRIVFDEEYVTRQLSMQGASDLVITYSSCTYELLPLWSIEVSLTDGSSFRLLERHEPPIDIDQTGPAALVLAELDLAGAERDVIDYWDLVYAASRHNLGVSYWAVLDPPLRVAGLESPVAVVEINAADEILGTAASVRYLNGSFQELASPAVATFSRESAPAPIVARFRRGDVNEDERVNLSDAVITLDLLFRGRGRPGCWKSADANGDGRIDLADPLRTLLHLFAGAEPLPAPFESCGEAPAEAAHDHLTCRRSQCP